MDHSHPFSAHATFNALHQIKSVSFCSVDLEFLLLLLLFGWLVALVWLGFVSLVWRSLAEEPKKVEKMGFFPPLQSSLDTAKKALPEMEPWSQ